MVTYTHWGLNTCLQGEKVLYTGRTANALASKNGATNYFCLPDEKVHADGVLEHPELAVNVVVLKGGKGKDSYARVPLLCAVCAVPLKPSVFVYIGRENECPPAWDVEYSGILGANPKWPTDYICVDNSVAGALAAERDDGIVAVGLDGNSKYDAYGAVSAVTCTVCTKTSIVM